MYLAYVDDSGDPGASGSQSFSLGCVLIRDEDWLDALDGLVSFRVGLRTIFGIPARAELKANTVIRGKGVLMPLRLSDHKLRRIFNLHMKVQATLGTVRTFAVVVDKSAHFSRPSLTSKSPESRAWEYLLQRLERFSTNQRTHIMIIHDHGRDSLYRGLARKWRRAGGAGSQYGGGWLSRPFTGLLDDPSPRDSRSSYFLQLADFAAYAAFRKIYPPSGPFPGTVRIVDDKTWDKLGVAKLQAVSGSGSAIVNWP